jgi:hypothetical protein
MVDETKARDSTGTLKENRATGGRKYFGTLTKNHGAWSKIRPPARRPQKKPVNRLRVRRIQCLRQL